MLKNYLNVDPTGRHPRTSTPQPTEVNEVFQPEDATRLVNWEIVEGEEVLDEQQKREDAQTAQMSETPDELVAQINAGKLKPTKSFLKRYELAYNRDFVKRWDAGQAALLKSTKYASDNGEHFTKMETPTGIQDPNAGGTVSMEQTYPSTGGVEMPNDSTPSRALNSDGFVSSLLQNPQKFLDNLDLVTQSNKVPLPTHPGLSEEELAQVQGKLWEEAGLPHEHPFGIHCEECENLDQQRAKQVANEMR